MNEFPILRSLSRWQKADDDDREAAVRSVHDLIGPQYAYLGLRRYGGSETPIATFMHGLGGEMVLLPGDRAMIGVSPANRRALAAISTEIWLPDDALPPARSVEIQPFLIARRPLDKNTLARLIAWSYPDVDKYLRMERTARRIDFRAVDKHDVLLLTPNQGFMAGVRHMMQLPTEAQWEYAYRAGASSLFPWGDDLPANRAQWNGVLLTNLGDNEAVEEASNAFGLTAMQCGELCDDTFDVAFEQPSRPSPDIEIVEQIPSMRGGAALFAPWRDTSWAMCISGSRWDPQYNFGDRCAVRLVKNIPQKKKKKAKKRK